MEVVGHRKRGRPLDAEDDAEVTDEEIADFIANSDPRVGGLNTPDPLACMTNAPGSTACWSDPEVPPLAASTTAASECNLTSSTELRWTFVSRFEACRRWNARLVIDVGEPDETWVNVELGTRVNLKPREAVAKMLATVTWRGISSESGVPHYSEDFVESRIDMDCADRIDCDQSVSIQSTNGGQPVHVVDSGWLPVNVATGEIVDIDGDLSVGFGLRQLQWSPDWTPARGPYQMPLSRCDGVTYMKNFSVNTKGCVLLEYAPTLLFVPSTQTTMVESARHIRRAQQEGVARSALSGPATPPQGSRSRPQQATGSEHVQLATRKRQWIL